MLTPLDELLTRRVLLRVIHNDDTLLPVQVKNTGKTKTGRLWDSVGDAANPYTVFHYTLNRSGEWPVFFKEYKGYLQVDAYTGYESLFTSGDIIEAACWAHVRRKFFEAKTTTKLRSHLMLHRSAAYTRSRMRSRNSGRRSGQGLATGSNTPSRCWTRSSNGCERTGSGAAEEPAGGGDRLRTE